MGLDGELTDEIIDGEYKATSYRTFFPIPMHAISVGIGKTEKKKKKSKGLKLN